MKKLALLVVSAGFAASLLSAQQVPQGREHSYLKVGDKAPDFTLPATNNTTFKLSDYKGKKNVVLAFFPAAFTAG
jgi:peroxiredoxin